MYSEDGNQNHDAIITDKSGNLIERIEITAPVDGKLEYLEAIQLNEDRISVRVGDPAKDRACVMQRILNGAKKKSVIDYGDASLLIVVNFYPEFFMISPMPSKILQISSIN